MTRRRCPLSHLSFAALLLCAIAPGARAQYLQTYLSNSGSDLNDCRLTTPCRTFGGVIAKTGTGGLVTVLESGSFGAIDINRSLTIDGGSHVVVAHNPTGSAAYIHAAATDKVVLRNLTLAGLGFANNGVRIVGGGAVHMENLQVRGFNSDNKGYGVWINPADSGDVHVYMDNVTVANNGTGTFGGGIYVQPIAPATATLQVEDSRIVDNAGFAGLRVDSGGFANVVSSSIAGNARHGAVVVSSANPADLSLQHTLVSGNGIEAATNGAGLQAQGTMASLRLANSTVTDNEHGVRALSGGIIVSYGNNAVYGNTTNGAATSTSTGF